LTFAAAANLLAGTLDRPLLPIGLASLWAATVAFCVLWVIFGARLGRLAVSYVSLAIGIAIVMVCFVILFGGMILEDSWEQAGVAQYLHLGQRALSRGNVMMLLFGDFFLFAVWLYLIFRAVQALRVEPFATQLNLMVAGAYADSQRSARPRYPVEASRRRAISMGVMFVFLVLLAVAFGLMRP
jgi:hypothetical protein